MKTETKTLILWLTILALFLILGAKAQTTVKRNEWGVFCEVKQPSDTTAKPTGDFYQDSKGGLHPVFISKNGKYFVRHTSKKTGKEYKHYLNLVVK